MTLARSSRAVPAWLAALAALLAAAPALAAGPSLTIYTRDLGLVRETRALELARGDTATIVDVPERIDFGSVRLVPASGRVTRLAYRWDVASGDGLLESARGRRVRVTSRGDRVAQGMLLAVDGSWLVVRADDGSVSNVARASIDDVRIENPPAGLSVRPSLEAVIDGASSRRLDAQLSYLTGGLSWTAEHVLVRQGESSATWSSRVIVENATGRSFENAELKLVAGEPRRERPMPPPMPMERVPLMGTTASAKQAADLSEESFSEYHLYTLGRPATLRDRESQSLSMIEPRKIEIRPRYLYRGGDPRGVMSQLRIANTEAAGLGMPLAAGRVRVYEADPSGALQFTGETSLRHTAEEETLLVEVGTAFDLVAERKETDHRRISDRERENSVAITLRNRKKTDVSIVVEEGIGGDFEVIRKTHDFVRRDANTIAFTVKVPAGRSVTVGYTVRVRY